MLLSAVFLAFLVQSPAGSADRLVAAIAPPGPPTPSAQSTTPLGIIGTLERDRKTQPSKLVVYVKDADPNIASRALLALGRLGNPSANDVLTAALGNQKSPDQVRATAAFALGLIGSASSVNDLANAARHAPPPVAAAAAESLGRLGGASAVETLIQLLSSRDAAIRLRAAVGLGEAALPGEPALDFAHQQSAAQTLASLIFSERDQEVRWREAWALGRGYYRNVPMTLRRLLTDDQELVRLFAVHGLGKLKDRTYALPIRLHANDPSWRVRVEVSDALSGLRDRTKIDVKPPAVPKSDFTEPQAVPRSAPFGEHPQVAIVTNKGVIVLELFPDQAPYSVDNFLALVDRGIYSGLTYFRVIADFVVQGGDPKNTGDGGPGYSIPAELNPLEQLSGIISYGLDYDTRAMLPQKDTAGSQYYITQSPQLHLDRAFTVFGRVVKGMAVVNAISPHSAGDRAPADVAKHVYRCRPVTPQTDEVELKLRTAEIGYDAR